MTQTTTRLTLRLSGGARKRTLRLAELARRCDRGTEVRVSYSPRHAWTLALLSTSTTALASAGLCLQTMEADEEAAFHEVARCLAPTGASWHWDRA